MLGHSTGLGGRLVSPINPRAVAAQAGAAAGTEYVAVAFTRGEQRVELVSLDRTTGSLQLLPDRVHPGLQRRAAGLHAVGDRFTPAIESDWLELSVRDDEELKNTKDDCLLCRDAAGCTIRTPPVLLMRELARPWMHWFSGEFSSTLRRDFRAARGDDDCYAGASRARRPVGLLQSTIRDRGASSNGAPPQPLLFESEIIAHWRPRSFLGTGRGPGADDRDLAESPTWRLLYEADLRGRRPRRPITTSGSPTRPSSRRRPRRTRIIWPAASSGTSYPTSATCCRMTTAARPDGVRR